MINSYLSFKCALIENFIVLVVYSETLSKTIKIITVYAQHAARYQVRNFLNIFFIKL